MCKIGYNSLQEGESLKKQKGEKTMENTNILQVRKWNYGRYSSDNYGANSLAVQMGARTVYYSYDTVVSFRGYNSCGEWFDCTCQNVWGVTTGKHLNWIDGGDKKSRLAPDEFRERLNEFLK